MISCESFKGYRKGDVLNLKVYEYDDETNKVYVKEKEGKLIQITKNIIVINNNYYNEAFNYAELNKVNKIQPSKIYNEECENYKEDMILDCVKLLDEGKESYLFNEKQVEKLKEIIPYNIEISKDSYNVYKIISKNT